MQHLRFAASGYFKISVCRIWQNVQFIQISKPIWAREGKNIFKEENAHNNIIIKIFLSYRSDLIFKSSYMEGKAKISIIFKSEWEKARTKRAV